MTAAACLLLYSYVVAVVAPRVLPAVTRTGSVPRLAVAVWLLTISTVVASWVASSTILLFEVLSQRSHFGRAVVDAHVSAVHDLVTGHVGLSLGLLIFSTGALLLLTARVCRSVARSRKHTRRHAHLVRGLGRTVGEWDAVLVDAPERVAYCVAGRRSTIVISSGAVAVLDERHLNAVLAHERAHLAGRHHAILEVTRAISQVLPRVRLFATANADLARLLEMCADDGAARVHGSGCVLGALVALTGPSPAPAHALGASSVGVLARAQRLASPASAAQRVRDRVTLAVVTGGVIAAPLTVVHLQA
ncbi:hypothetical protein CBI38_36060 (plasmid) [Rhodococcus oxybenzonivorans]|uniref:Peptidase M48 domain-containing protein n=1 Tax=Rhodococcus oxybenzonivorans TaxID=1990687 RepID=A0A2S2C7H0_9NOCA|nr:M56 family metallopeptidase [Rhodococcus oxybenzonivorans]AWK76821.1 hypothetical protein CBI38_36060 [Rhodococcus oxybenzonivorans]